MYQVKPKGINTRQNDRDVADGFLQESINLQWRDGAIRPIPERLNSGITDTSDKEEIILHKVSDENIINVLMFDSEGALRWYGVIDDGVYTALSSSIAIDIPTISNLDSVSFTILSGIIYIMGISDEFYYRIQYDEINSEYVTNNMYAWKDLIPYYPVEAYPASFPKGSDTHFLQTRCGVISYRFSLVLKTGEEVLHSPIYAIHLTAINRSTANFTKGDILTNIHTLINTNFEFLDDSIYEDEMSAINIYASIPYYKTTVDEDTTSNITFQSQVGEEESKSEVQQMAEFPYFLVKTISNPSADKTENAIMFYLGDIDEDIDYSAYDYTKVDISTVAAGQVMPVDNYSYHKLYGKLSTNNGRIIINSPKTVLSNGHLRALATISFSTGTIGYRYDSEDGQIDGLSFALDKTLNDSGGALLSGGLLSYPDIQGTYVGSSSVATENLLLYKIRRNTAHNLSCAFDFSNLSFGGQFPVDDGTNIEIVIDTRALFVYAEPDEVILSPTISEEKTYTSENRIQFSESGEFSVWPAINSYRVGEGRILFVGDNSIDPSNSDYIAPLLIGSSDGVYTVNFDVTGTNLIQSITKAANMPAISSNNILVDQNLIYVSDKGLIAINSGKIVNLTRDYFPEQGNGGMPTSVNQLAFNLASFLSGTSNQESIMPNYDILTGGFLGTGNIYTLDDIINYMKGALFAYDGRRNNIWCCNPAYVFSLIFNYERKKWTMSSYTFNKVVDLFSILKTDQGDIYSRNLVLNESDGGLDILSGEDLNTEVEVHLLTRPIKMNSVDVYKKVERLIARCEIFRSSEDSYFGLGLWGKQDVNSSKEFIPLVAYSDASANSFPNNIRQDIPIGRLRGKYKLISILQNAKCLPNSSFDGYDIVAIPVNNKILR